jgi:hypothetical protein
VLTYLEIKKDDFYKVETTVDGKAFVTARGWDDLSQMIKLYEMNGIKVDLALISQYIQNPKIARNFAAYYDLYQKYKSDYQVEKILSGNAPDEIKTRAGEAKFDERLSLLSMIMDTMLGELKEISELDNTILELVAILKEYRAAIRMSRAKPGEELKKSIQNLQKKIDVGKKIRKPLTGHDRQNEAKPELPSDAGAAYYR